MACMSDEDGRYTWCGVFAQVSLLELLEIGVMFLFFNLPIDRQVL
jgi:hypothetical protein